MFKVEDDFIIWEDSKYKIPDECLGKGIVNIYGTATAGLSRCIGIFLELRGDSIRVALENKNVSGRLVGNAPVLRGSIVYLREQLEPLSGKQFWLISEEEIKNDVNWINVKFDDNSTLRLCPFTMDYGVIY